MALDQKLSKISIKTNGEGFVNITAKIDNWIKKNNIQKGILAITCLHTSCSLIINENADPRVLEDLSNYMKALVPEEGFRPISGFGKLYKYSHSDEGIDDMPAHIRSTLTCNSLSLSIDKFQLLIGIWQAVYLWEHRYTGSERDISIHAIGNFVKE